MKMQDLMLADGSFDAFAMPRAKQPAPSIEGALGVQTGQLVISRLRDQSYVWETVSGIIEFRYPFESFTFTNAGATGMLGPTLAQCLSAYGTSAPFVTPEHTYLSMGTRGMQRLVVPTTGLYRITAIGASCPGRLAQPAIVDIDVVLAVDDVLTIAVGQQGTHVYCGSGASWVSHSSAGLLLPDSMAQADAPEDTAAVLLRTLRTVLLSLRKVLVCSGHPLPEIMVAVAATYRRQPRGWEAQAPFVSSGEPDVASRTTL